MYASPAERLLKGCINREKRRANLVENQLMEFAGGGSGEAIIGLVLVVVIIFIVWRLLSVAVD